MVFIASDFSNEVDTTTINDSIPVKHFEALPKGKYFNHNAFAIALLILITLAVLAVIGTKIFHI